MQAIVQICLVTLEMTSLALAIYGCVTLSPARSTKEQGRCYLFSQSQPCEDCLFQVKLVPLGTSRLLQASFTLDFENVYDRTIIKPEQYFGCCLRAGLDCCKFFDADSNRFCDNWGPAGGCNSGVWPCSFLWDQAGNPVDVQAEYFNASAVKLLVAVSAAVFLVLIHFHYQKIRTFSLRLLRILLHNPVALFFLTIAKHVILAPWYLVVLATPDSIRSKLYMIWCKMTRQTDKPINLYSKSNFTLDIQPVQGTGQSPQETVATTVTAALNVTSVSVPEGKIQKYRLHSNPAAIPGEVEEIISQLSEAELAKRKQLLNSRTPAAPPPEPQTYARHIELPAPPRVAGRPRDRKAQGDLHWWGSGLPN